MFQKLFESGCIGSLKLKNRIVLAPMGPGNMQNRDGIFNERIRDYYESIAKGGTGLLITGSSPVSRVTGSEGKDPINTLFLDRSYVGGASETVDAVHRHGAKICLQLCISDGRTFPWEPEPACASAGLRSVVHPNLVSREITIPELEQIVKDYGNAASLAKEAGFDAIEIRAYGGYFTDEFLTALWNKRTDKYGGDLDGRMTFLLECIDAVQKACGKDYPLIVKITPDHGLEGGRTIEEGKELARKLEATGIHALHLDYGCWDSHYNQIPPTYVPVANQIWIAEEIKKVVSIPVISNGKLGVEPAVAEQALANGKTDFIGLGRALLADPEWPKKVKEGRLMDIRYCIGCMKCQERIGSGKYISCALNPQTGNEREFKLTPAEDVKNVLVIGGGPGGMEAARVAALRGHKVTLVEKNLALGGRLIEAAAPSLKKQLNKTIEYYKHQLPKAGVEIELGIEMTAESIAARNADVVIVATGAQNRRLPDIKGMDLENVYTADQILLGEVDWDKLGEKTLVIGASEVGCEVALHIAELHGGNITVTTRQVEIAPKSYFTSRLWLKKKLKETGIDVLRYGKLLEIAKDHVMLEIDGEARKIEADNVILSLGYVSDTSLADQLDGKVKELYTIGDSVEAREVLSAVWEGFHVGRMI